MLCFYIDDAREAMADYNIRLAYWELAILLRYMEWACTVVTGEAHAHCNALLKRVGAV